MLFKEAMHAYTTACRLMPSFAVAHSNLGSILKEQNKLEEALAHYTKAIEIDPSFALCYNNMGTSTRISARRDAITCFTKAVKLQLILLRYTLTLRLATRRALRGCDYVLEKGNFLKPEYRMERLPSRMRCSNFATGARWKTTKNACRYYQNAAQSKGFY